MPENQAHRVRPPLDPGIYAREQYLGRLRKIDALLADEENIETRVFWIRWHDRFTRAVQREAA